MTDYSYDAGHQVHLDDHDRGKNAPSALEGYPLDLSPQEDWPGRGAVAGDVQIDPEAALDVADWLEQQARYLQDVPARLASGTQTARFGPSTWIEAGHLSTASDQVSKAVSEFGTEMVANLTAAATAIRAAVSQYQQADSTNKTSASNVGSGLQGQYGLPDHGPAAGSGSVQAW